MSVIPVKSSTHQRSDTDKFAHEQTRHKTLVFTSEVQTFLAADGSFGGRPIAPSRSGRCTHANLIHIEEQLKEDMMTTQSQAELSEQFNAVNRGVYISDNLPFLRSLNDESIDLVCIDPPFAKNDTFTGDNLDPPLSESERETERRLLASWGIRSSRDALDKEIQWPEDLNTRGGYKDIWSWENDIHEEWIESIDDNYPSISKLIDATRYVHGEGTAAYLCYMAIRLIEIHRVLTSNGSLWLHCDQTANAYLRQLLDGVFGKDNLINQVNWERIKGAGKTNQFKIRSFGNASDTIFFYSKSRHYRFNADEVARPYPDIERDFPLVDDKGRYKRRDPFGPPGLGARPNLCYTYKGVTPPHPSGWTVMESRLKELDEDGELDWRPNGKVYRKQRPRAGIIPNNIWTDIDPAGEDERTGYPTQKPWRLAERIIKASTNPNDVVLDCFAGCAYTAVAAEKTGRQWVACDINPRAWTVFKRQCNNPDLVLLKCNDDTTGQQVIGTEPVVTVHGPTELPQRTSPISEVEPASFDIPERKFKVPKSLIPDSEMLRELLQLSDYQAWCCGFANRRSDGSVIESTRNFHLDHIDPKSKQGSNQIPNRAPLCPHHNIRKGNKRIHLAEYREVIAHAGEMMVDHVGQLIDLAWAYEEALKIHSAAELRRNPQGTMMRR